LKPGLEGAGGVPLRKKEDLERIYEAARCGNFPLVRCYSGTRDLLKWAELQAETINNAWAAIPLCWYNRMDGRSARKPIEAIRENIDVIRWYAERRIPVEINEAHQWSLRGAHDALAVAMAYLAAYNAKNLGVTRYVAQYMFNTPAGTSAAMDLAKMAAKAEMIDGLHDSGFVSYRQVRAGLTHFSSDFDIAKGQLASSAVVSLALRPHIFHVVGYCEAHHAATPQEIIESCRIVRGVFRNCLEGFPDMMNDRMVIRRKKKLIREARIILSALKEISDSADPWVDPDTIIRAVEIGILDAPHLKGSEFAAGRTTTAIIDGACFAVDTESGEILPEEKRIQGILERLARVPHMRGI
jgi:hypothetical protein